ncbi:MAG: hypothetical protein ACR2OO_13750, partial [Thermomicrobiales bacterium]
AAPDGSSGRFPVGFATVDHPFHAVRGELLRRSVVEGHPLRWIASHQGGYPTEFYPLGAAALDVGVWFLALGALPMIAVHKLVVIAVFLLPGLAFARTVKADRLTYGVALLAFAGQVSVRGWWWSGGSRELVEWGLITNVAAATALLFVLPALQRFAARGDWRGGAIAACFAAFALVCNPRSGIALVAIVIGVVATVALDSGRDAALIALVRRIAAFGMLAFALAAPEIVSLVRFNHLYYFVRYSGYLDLREYLQSSVQAVSSPFFVLGLVGLAAAVVDAERPTIRAAALTLVTYCGLTAYAVSGSWPGSLIEQLETTRLMPFQRFLWLLMAGYGAWFVLALVARRLTSRRLLAADVALAALMLLSLLGYVLVPFGVIPGSDRGLVAMATSVQPGIIDLEAAVREADRRAPPGTAILVLGSTYSWHDQMWAPMWSDRPFFYDDWLWYWQQRHFGDYDPALEHAYPSPNSALRPEYLRRHGIGAVIATKAATKSAAAASPALNRVRAGIYDVYLVYAPTPIVTYGSGTTAGIAVGDSVISASGTSDGGDILVRRNWYPRWEATVNGRSAPIVQTADGYMSIAAPAGSASLTLRYATDWIDWLGRGLCVGGLAVVALLMGGKGFRAPTARRVRRRGADSS